MSLLAALAGHLDTLGHGTYSTSAVYTDGQTAIVIGHTPAAPDRCITLAVYDSGIEPDGRNPWDNPRVQIRVRGTTDITVSADLADAIYGDLHATGLLDLGAVYLYDVVALHAGPVYIGADNANRHEHTLNFRVDHSAPTTHRA